MHIWVAERSVGEVMPGDHAFLPFATREEQEHIVGEFVRDGLATAEKVVYVGDAVLGELPGLRNRGSVDPHRHAGTGQLRVIPREVACLSGGRVDPDRMSAVFRHEISVAFDAGYRAVRLTADLSWVLGEPGGSELLLECEERFEAAVAPSTMAMALCQINRSSCTWDQFAALENTHEVLVVATPVFDDGVLRITRTFAPHGLRFEGELDEPRHAVFTEALSWAGLRPRVHLDFRRVRFADLGLLTLLAAHAASLPPGHRLILEDLPPHMEGVIETLGWHHFPGISRGQGVS
jgi:hypothetical protein